MNLADYRDTVAHLTGQPWIRWWPHDALSDLRIRRLPEDARGAYPFVLSLAAASEAPGALVDIDGTPLTPDGIARDTGFAEKTIRRFIAAALRRSILAELDDGALYFPAFADRQLSREEHDRMLATSERQRERAERRWAASRQQPDAHTAAPTPAPATAHTAAVPRHMHVSEVGPPPISPPYGDDQAVDDDPVANALAALPKRRSTTHAANARRLAAEHVADVLVELVARAQNGRNPTALLSSWLRDPLHDEIVDAVRHVTARRDALAARRADAARTLDRRRASGHISEEEYRDLRAQLAHA